MRPHGSHVPKTTTALELYQAQPGLQVITFCCDVKILLCLRSARCNQCHDKKNNNLYAWLRLALLKCKS